MQEKYVNAFILLVLLLLSIRVLVNFNRQKKYYEKFMESLTGGEIFRKMVQIKKDDDAGAGAGEVVATKETSPVTFKKIENNPQKSCFKFIKGQKIKKRGMNNCLFDAVIESLKRAEKADILPTEDSQKLRELCDELLEKEGFPLIPHGEPAGEQYIQALSKILGYSIKIHKDHPDNFMADVKHSDVGDDAPALSIVHLGSEDFGHWVSF